MNNDNKQKPIYTRKRRKHSKSSLIITAFFILMPILRFGAQIIKPFADQHQARVASSEQGRILEDEAKNTLITFFNLLSNQDYEEAVAFYGGSYDELAALHPQDANSPSALLEDACTVDAYLCYPINAVSSVHSVGSNDFEFGVQFAIDGNSFKGRVNEDAIVGQEFAILVAPYNGQFQIKTLPSSPLD